MDFFEQRHNASHDVKKKRRLTPAFSDTNKRITSSGRALQIAC